MLVAIEKALKKLTLSRALKYRSREIELMREILSKVTEDDYLPVNLTEDVYELFHKKIGTVPISLAIVDEDMRLRYANPQFERGFPGLKKIDKEFLQFLNQFSMDISYETLISNIKNIFQSETGDIKVIGRESRNPQILLAIIDATMEKKRGKLAIIVIPLPWAVRSAAEQTGMGDSDR